MINSIHTVCVYCASSTKVSPLYFEAARELGRLLAQKEIRLVTGAGSLGLMRAIEDSALEAGGQVTGVIPRFMVEEGWGHTGLTQLIETADMHERKEKMASLADGIIALPGGCGTLEELLEIITWKQLGLYSNPVVILNVNGFYDPLLAQLSRAVEEHFMGDLHASLWQVATTPAQAIELLYTTPKWNTALRKFAAI